MNKSINTQNFFIVAFKQIDFKAILIQKMFFCTREILS